MARPPAGAPGAAPGKGRDVGAPPRAAPPSDPTAGEGRTDGAGAAAPPLPLRFARLLDERPGLLPRGSGVILAVSGGPDSTALALLVAGVARPRGLRPLVAHFDHRVRPESGAEAERVAAIAERLDLPFRCGRPAVRPEPDAAVLRRARYTWLERLRSDVGAARIATGHQADDVAETVLFHILRGTGLRGLRGIPRRRGPIVRPLLDFRREELGSWLGEIGVPWVEDPSNRDPRWTRARLRTSVLPVLAAATEGDVTPALGRIAAAAATADRALAAVERRLIAGAVRPLPPQREGAGFRLRRDILVALPGQTAGRCLRRLARRLGVRLRARGTRAGVEFISRGRSGGGVDLGGGLVLRREYGWFVLELRRDPPPDREVEIREPGRGRAHLRLGGRGRFVSWEPAAGGENSKGRGRVALSVARGHYPLRLRARRPGDRIRLPGGSRTLKRLLGDRRVPAGDRDAVPVLVDGGGRVLWVPGLAVAADAAAGREASLAIEVTDDD